MEENLDLHRQKETIQTVEFQDLGTEFRECSYDTERKITQHLYRHGNIYEQIPIFRTLGFYKDDEELDICKDLPKQREIFKQMFNYQGETIDTNANYFISHESLNFAIFFDKAFENDKYYIIHSKNGFRYFVLKDDLIRTGLVAQSLKLLGQDKIEYLKINKKIQGSELNSQISEDGKKIIHNIGRNYQGESDGTCFTDLENSNDKNIVYIGNDNCIYECQIERTKGEIKDAKINKGTPLELKLGEIIKIYLDPLKNFLFIISKNKTGTSDLHILDRKKVFNEHISDEIKTIEGIGDIIILDSGIILLKKLDDTIDILQTNMTSLSIDEGISFKAADEKTEEKKKQKIIVTNSTRQRAINALKHSKLSYNDEEESNTGDEKDKEVIESIREKDVEGKGKTLKELFDDANSEDEITVVRNIFKKCILNEFSDNISDLLKPIEEEILNKKHQIILNAIFSELTDIATELSEEVELDKLIIIKAKLKNIENKRKNIPAGMIEKDKKLEDLLNLVNEKIEEYQKLHGEEFKEKIEEYLDKIKEILNNINHGIDISSIYSNEVYTATEEIISKLDPDSQIIYREKLQKLIKNRVTEITNSSKQEKQQNEKLIKAQIQEIEKNIQIIEQIVNNIDDIESLEEYHRNDNMIQNVIKQISEIQSHHAQQLQIKLNSIFNKRAQKLKSGNLNAKGIIKNLDSYGIDTSLYYIEEGTEKVERTIEGKEKNGKISLVLKLMNGQTRTYDKSFYLKNFEEYSGLQIRNGGIKFDMDEEEFNQYSQDFTKRRQLTLEERIKLKNKIKNEKNKIKDKKSEIEDKEKEIENKKSEIENKKEEIEKKEKEIKNLEENKDSDNYKEKIEKLEAEIKKLKDEAKKLEDEAKKLEDETKKLEDETKKLEDETKKLEDSYIKPRYTEILVNRLIRQLNLNPREQVPEFDPNYIVLDEDKEILKRLSQNLLDQMENGGIEILEGGPGCGKTTMCEFIAQITNREKIRVQCSKMDPSDMFFSPTLKDNETSREAADWIKLMQKPGTIIIFDEIDKLNDACIERLHSLFDKSRSVYDPQLGTIKANKDCLFLGTRNSYEELSNPMLSRGRIIEIEYPTELNEAFKMSKYANNQTLNDMGYEEFKALYEKYITRKEAAPNSTKNKETYDLITNISLLIKVFKELRDLYKKGGFNKFIYEISLRDARQIFVEYNNSGNFKEAMEKILIPKAKGTVIDQRDKDSQSKMVKDAIESAYAGTE